MTTNLPVPDYKGFRYPAEIISHAVWMYFRFSLSFRDVEELLAARGIAVTYETVRQWCLKFGQTYANELRRRRPRCGDKWHMDEVFLTIRGERYYLWRAVDQEGKVLDILVQSRRNKQAAKRFSRKLLKGLQDVPRVIMTDKLASSAAAKREILASVEHRQHKGLNNRAERSHQPTRQRERTMRASNPLDRLNGFSPLLDRFWITFGPNGIISLQRITMLSCKIVSWSGTREREGRLSPNSKPSFPVLCF